MQLRSNNILTGVLVMILAIFAIGAVVYVVIEIPTTKQTTVREAKFAQYRESASIYKARMTDYDGVCEELLLPADTRCASSEESYLVVAKISEGMYRCLDATGFMGTITNVPEGLTCR